MRPGMTWGNPPHGVEAVAALVTSIPWVSSRSWYARGVCEPGLPQESSRNGTIEATTSLRAQKAMFLNFPSKSNLHYSYWNGTENVSLGTRPKSDNSRRWGRRRLNSPGETG